MRKVCAVAALAASMLVSTPVWAQLTPSARLLAGAGADTQTLVAAMQKKKGAALCRMDLNAQTAEASSTFAVLAATGQVNHTGAQATVRGAVLYLQTWCAETAKK
jgi:hypothetical protein